MPSDKPVNARKPQLWWNQAWTLVEGCTRCSDGCKDCWALALEERTGRVAGPEGMVLLRKDRLERPLHWRKPRVVAVWNDFFHEAVCAHTVGKGAALSKFQIDAFHTMGTSPQHQFILLTKRAKRMRQAIEWGDWAECWNQAAPDYCGSHTWPPPNVILGVTCESDEYLWRVEELAKTPAAVRFVNAHLLGPLDGVTCGLPADGLCPYPCDPCDAEHPCSCRIDWLAIECNRPFRGSPETWWRWCSDLVEEATAADVPVWVKQGPTASGRVSHALEDFPPWARRREFPKKEKP